MIGLIDLKKLINDDYFTNNVRINLKNLYYKIFFSL